LAGINNPLSGVYCAVLLDEYRNGGYEFFITCKRLAQLVNGDRDIQLVFAYPKAHLKLFKEFSLPQDYNALVQAGKIIEK